MRAFRRPLGECRVPLAPLVADQKFASQPGSSGVESARVARSYPLNASGPGAAVELTVSFSRSAAVAASRRQTRSSEVASSTTI